MSRISNCFAQLRADGRKALIPYVTAGDPGKQATVPLMHAMVQAGANILELGVPFSDPMADGPVIQRASERALLHHTSLRDVLAMVAEFRQRDTTTPVVLMGYLNPIEAMGYAEFARVTAEAGVDGVLTVDLPPEEGEEFNALMRQYGLDPIFLIAPTSTGERIRMLCGAASGFVYYVALKGVTGAGNLDIGSVVNKLREIRAVSTLPLGVGFGVNDASSAAQLAAYADAVIVGSALVRKVEENQDSPEQMIAEVSALLGGMRQAMDKV